ncbi:hypothetical protein BRC78_00805 [Halobacteriales archaeon QH_8_68_33]|nr:MAG: hypothetical protein BRC78_00805 [Halobacteriales archaeon QH_8_68_33]
MFALLLAAAGPAGALTISDQTDFGDSRVGETVSTAVVIEDPFTDQPDEWTLRGSTELENVSWTVTVLQQGNQINETVYGDQTFEQTLSLDNGGDEVRIDLVGDTPAVENHTYDPRETYVLWDLVSVTGSSESTLNTSTVHHYTNDSREARNAIDNATMAVNGSGNQDAQDQLNRSVEAYNGGQFDLAIDTAQDAQNTAEQAEQSQQQTQTLIYAAIALVVLAIIGGGVYYWRANQDEPTKLQ